jgi:hypothetical protein
MNNLGDINLVLGKNNSGKTNNNICGGIYTSLKDEETYQVNVIPMINPFDKDGAVEAVLVDAIEQEKSSFRC